MATQSLDCLYDLGVKGSNIFKIILITRNANSFSILMEDILIGIMVAFSV